MAIARGRYNYVDTPITQIGLLAVNGRTENSGNKLQYKKKTTEEKDER